MKCEKCGKNPATIQTKITINGVTTQKMLCESCWAQEHGFSSGTFSVNDLLKGFMPSSAWEETQNIPRCSVCGTDLNTFSKTGLLGCANCYETFRPYLNNTLKKFQDSLHHVGRRPGQKPAEAPAPTPNQVDALKSALAMAIKSERYEEAAVLRDRIRALEAQTKETSKEGLA